MKNEFIIIKIGRNRYRKIYLNEILYCKADGSYSVIKTDTSEYTLSKCMKGIEHLFVNVKFIKINRSFIVNIDKCIELKIGKNPKLTICNNEEIKPSAIYINELKKVFGIN